MANLNVYGKVMKNGQEVAGVDEINGGRLTLSYTLYSASLSVATGEHSILSTYKFSQFKTLAIGVFSTATNGYAWQFMSLEIFKRLVPSDLGSFYVQQNIASQDRRLKLYYVDDTHFNISYLDGASGLAIIGFL